MFDVRISLCFPLSYADAPLPNLFSVSDVYSSKIRLQYLGRPTLDYSWLRSRCIKRMDRRRHILSRHLTLWQTTTVINLIHKVTDTRATYHQHARVIESPVCRAYLLRLAYHRIPRATIGSINTPAHHGRERLDVGMLEVVVSFEWQTWNHVHWLQFLKQQFARVGNCQRRDVLWRPTVVTPTCRTKTLSLSRVINHR